MHDLEAHTAKQKKQIATYSCHGLCEKLDTNTTVSHPAHVDLYILLVHGCDHATLVIVAANNIRDPAHRPAATIMPHFF